MSRLQKKVLVSVLVPLSMILLTPTQKVFADVNIDFTTGLNVVNYPVQVPPDYTSYDFLTDLRVTGDVRSVQRFDRTAGVFQTAVWDLDRAGPVGVEFALLDEEAFFVYSEEDFAFIFPGDPYCTTEDLKEGYNLVAFSCSDGISAWSLLNSLGELNVEGVKRYDSISGTYEYAYWDSGVAAGDDFTLVHGEGYQVNMLDNLSYSATTPDPPVLSGYPGDGVVALSWEPPAGFIIVGYHLYRGDVSGGPYTEIGGGLLDRPSYSDNTVANGTPYYYVVTAEGVTGDESIDSNEVEAIPVVAGPTSIGGTLEDDEYLWDLAGSPYIITSTTTIPSYTTLTIEPGVQIRFDGDYSFNVYGSVQAIGTEDNPIYFTSNQGSPAWSDWSGINLVEYGGQSVFEYCIVEYADNGFDISWGSPRISHCTIRQCYDRGINLLSTVGAVIEFCTIEDNRYYGIVLHWQSDATIRYNTITGNGWDGIYVDSSSPIIMGNDIRSNDRYGLYIIYECSSQITGNIITGNDDQGIYLKGDNSNESRNPYPVINGNSIYGNDRGVYDLYTYDYVGDRVDLVVDATGNWWGTADHRTILSRIYDYNDNVNEGPVVDFRSFLDEEGGTPIPGNFVITERLDEDTTWSAAESPYRLVGDIFVPGGSTFTIEEGTEVQLGGYFRIQVNGTILAEGEEESPILITSDKTSPVRGDWEGIFFYKGSDASLLSYCTVEYSDTYGIYITEGSPTISHCLIQHGDDRGIYVSGGSEATIADSLIQINRYEGIYVSDASPIITGNEIIDNSRYGVQVWYDSSPQIIGNVIYSNNSYGIYLRGDNSSSDRNPTPVINANSIYSNGGSYDLYTWDYTGDRVNIVIDATGNWWGTADHRTIGTRIYDYNDNANEGPVVDFRSFLDAEGGSSVPGTYLLAQSVDSDTTWSASESPYTIVGKITVPAGVTLTIEAGTEFQVGGYLYKVQVYGTLLAEGTELDPILFTSDKASPVRGDWDGIYFYEGSDASVLSYCTIEYSDEYGIYIHTASPTISHCLIQHGDDRGIYVYGGSEATIADSVIQINRYEGIYVDSASPIITGNEIRDNTRYGLYIQHASSPAVTGNLITGNSNHGIYLRGDNSSSDRNPAPVINENSIYSNGGYELYTWDYAGDRINTVIDATGNWWDTSDHRTIGTHIYDYNDNASEGPAIDFRSFLDGEGGTPVPGNYLIVSSLAEDTTWNAAESPYLIVGKIFVPTGVTLTIEAGTEIQFGGYYRIQVNGTLLAEGVDGTPILFTSDRPTPAWGDWDAIYFYEGSDASVMSYCTVEYADNYGIYISTTSPTISHCLIQEGDSQGIHVTGGSSATIADSVIQNIRYEGLYVVSSSPVITDNEIRDNNRYGVQVWYESSPLITGNLITGNNSYGIYLRGDNSDADRNPTPVINGNSLHSNGGGYELYTWDYTGDRGSILVDATGNWWGTTDHRTIGTRIYDYNDNSNEGPVVDFRDFLDGEGGSPVAGSFLLAQTIDSDTTWSVAGGPYTILGKVMVPEGVTLTIEAGTEIRFGGVYHVQVYGTLLALGEDGNPILFSSDKASPAMGDWNGIYFYEGSDDSVLSYCTIEYADTYGIYIITASPTISNCLIRQCDDRGIHLTNGALATIADCVIQDNRYYGIVIATSSHATIDGNTISGNRDGIYIINSSPQILDNIVQSNSRYGIWVLENSAPLITGNTVIDNSTYGFLLDGNNNIFYNPQPVINGNSIHDNGGSYYYDIYTQDFAGDLISILVDATGNWWGTADPRAIGQKIFDYNDDAYNERPVVDCRGFLDGEGGSPVAGNYLIAQRIYDETLWTAGESPYILMGNMLISSGGHLTIEPGVEVQVAGPYYLFVYGKLTSVGASDSRVVFTSEKTNPVRGDWKGFIFYDGSDDTSAVSYTTIEYAYNGIECHTASPTISQCLLRYNNNAGMWLNTSAAPTIEENTIFFNYNYGLYIENGSDATIRRNVITETERYDGIYIYSSSPLIEENLIEANKRYGIQGYISVDSVMTRNTIINNSSYGIYLRGNNNEVNNPEPVMNENNIYGNYSQDLYTASYGAASTVTLDATGNWWGSDDPVVIEGRIYHNPDYPSYCPFVDFSSYASDEVGLPTVTEVTADDDIFSPNADTVQDEVTFEGTLSGEGEWYVSIMDESFSVVREYSGLGTSFSIAWDGRDGGGVLVDDGVYFILMYAVIDGETTLVRMIQVEVDNTGPTAVISSPTDGSTLFDLIEIQGTADDPNFVDYTVEYGEGATPVEWFVIGSVGTSTIVDALLESWVTNETETDTIYYPNGLYTLRLTVLDEGGNTTIHSIAITLDNLYISELSLSAKTVDLGAGETADLSFTLSMAATVTLSIYPEWEGTDGELVKEFVMPFASGPQMISWDGTNTLGETVPDEAYVYFIEAVAGDRTDAYRPTGGHTVGSVSGSVDPSYDAASNNYWQMPLTVSYNQRVSLQITPSGQSAYYYFYMKPMESGSEYIVWDGRGEDGVLLDVTSNMYYPAPTTMRPNFIITTGAAPTVAGQAPYVEVKTDPFWIATSYGQVSTLKYNIDQAANVTIKLLGPAVGDPESLDAVTLVDNQLLSAGDHELDFNGLDESDVNGMTLLTGEDGTFTLYIEATSPTTGLSDFWRTSIQLYQ